MMSHVLRCTRFLDCFRDASLRCSEAQFQKSRLLFSGNVLTLCASRHCATRYYVYSNCHLVGALARSREQCLLFPLLLLRWACSVWLARAGTRAEVRTTSISNDCSSELLSPTTCSSSMATMMILFCDTCHPHNDCSTVQYHKLHYYVRRRISRLFFFFGCWSTVGICELCYVL